MIKHKTKKIIDLDDWDKLVMETYGRPYSFQQQDGCKSRGIHNFTVPEDCEGEFENETVPEEVNHEEMGVSFAAWLKRDPKEPIEKGADPDGFSLTLWWDRNFYPEFQMVANDLHAKGLIEDGEYSIEIDW